MDAPIIASGHHITKHNHFYITLCTKNWPRCQTDDNRFSSIKNCSHLIEKVISFNVVPEFTVTNAIWFDQFSSLLKALQMYTQRRYT